MWSEGTGPTLSGNAADVQYTLYTCALFVTSYWAMKYTSFGHWLLDSSGASCVPGNLRHLAIGSWTHPERLAFRVMTSLGHWCLDSSGVSCIPGNMRHLAIGSWTHPASCVLGNVRHLVIGSWTHPERLAFRVMYVTWPLALGLIRIVLRSGYCVSLGHWLLDSSGASCVLGNVRHLAIGTWTHPGCRTLTGIKIARHWLHESVRGS
ncbi:hypothetical protein Tco_1125369 [Tanacetum coccineum]|uniref:Uncharacterized protein n=1 Tax=Tanacetum coccineum TaxID=301880 RepID=A0ABQ5JCV7_9ASTR